MKKLTESKLLAGFIYGDHHTKEYVYLPGSELARTFPSSFMKRMKGGATYPWMRLWTLSKKEV